MEQNYYKYENNVNYKISEIKDALKSILETYKVRFLHEEKDLNDAFGTYRFGEIKCSYMVTLTQIDENNTKIVINCSSRAGFQASMASLEGYTNEFLAILTAKLSGASDEEMISVVKENNSDGSLSGFAGVMSIIIFIVALYFIIKIIML